ncbi:YtxH domain-containing protein [Geomesophilobacter sediminis]|uniref:YtxH domain-containing protein n=1 Tax=Geomesophilobacter sediminis TaxID=2798584 RepID=A0A8J7LU17_9BACT|nr:YtxH domain-containing protein [Geomesophilobacter sediminis]MBJ6723250.1 YtxH domain-containing protein [Geomesophilobacter sediminis]
MSKRNEQAAVLAFIAGAVVAAGAALLLTPKSGREVREKLGAAKQDALTKLKACVNKGKRGSHGEGLDYDGGDAWI